ncbi:MAG: peptidoglycan editing factor PgeF [Cytophagales bacterium]|nr:peptidoglycan editing factor PgeF [Cytophaga sp.]
MLEHTYATLKNWQFESFTVHDTIKHLVSGRNPQFSNGTVPGLNFSFNVLDDPDRVTQNRTLIADIFGLTESPVIIPRQTHSDHIGIITHETIHNVWEDTDALITNISHVIIGVLSADCVPVLLADPMKGVVAAIHAGWKGTAKEIVPKTIQQMQALFHSDPKDIIAGIGPSISSQCYEVGADVAVHFRASSKTEKDTGKSCIDLWKENETQLLQSGVPLQNISIAGLCTYRNPDLFYSARRDGLQTGRMASFISLNR